MSGQRRRRGKGNVFSFQSLPPPSCLLVLKRMEGLDGLVATPALNTRFGNGYFCKELNVSQNLHREIAAIVENPHTHTKETTKTKTKNTETKSVKDTLISLVKTILEEEEEEEEAKANGGGGEGG